MSSVILFPQRVAGVLYHFGENKGLQKVLATHFFASNFGGEEQVEICGLAVLFAPQEGDAAEAP
jgi:hypothetical protein